MNIEFNELDTNQKYELFKRVVNKVQKADGNGPEHEFQEQDGYVNLIAARGFSKGKSCESKNDVFDDTIFVVYRKNGQRYVEAFVASTEYSSASASANAVLAFGQYKYRLHYHHESASVHTPLSTTDTWVQGAKYRALEPNPAGPGVRVWRDYNQNMTKDSGEGYYGNNYSINIHYGATNAPGGSSDGCQILQNWSRFKEFIRLVELDTSIKGSINNEMSPKPAEDGTRAVIYTLVKGTFIEETLREGGGLAFPIDLGCGRMLDDESIEEYYKHTEKSSLGGYFPVGINSVWHGGIHIYSPKGSEIRSCLSGRIVAARLGEDANTVNAEWGSRNFILVRHEIQSRIFYSLYMHLDILPLTAENEFIKKLVWLGTPILKYRFKGTRLYRAAAVNGEVKGQFGDGDEAEWVEDSSPAPWKKLRLSDGNEWFAHCGPEIADEVRVFRPNDELLNTLKSGNVVKLDIEVAGNQVLWQVGDGGHSLQASGLLHWEIFSEENVFPPLAAEQEENEAGEETDEAAESTGETVEQILVRKVEGPAKVYPGKKATYRASFDKANPTAEEKKQINWVVLLDGAEVLKKEKHGDTLVLEINEDWKGKKIVVMPYRNAPVPKYSVDTQISTRKPIVWLAVEDTNDDFNMDSEAVLTLFESSQDDNSLKNILTMDELKRFYAENPEATKLRTYACKFVGEWAISNLDAAIDRLKGNVVKTGLKESFEKYQCWKEVSDAGVALPSKPLCWHYNPITVLEALYIESGMPSVTIDGEADTSQESPAAAAQAQPAPQAAPAAAAASSAH